MNQDVFGQATGRRSVSGRGVTRRIAAGVVAALLWASPAAAQEDGEVAEGPTGSRPSDNPAENPLPLPPQSDDAAGLDRYLTELVQVQPADKTRDGVKDHVADLMARVDMVLKRKLPIDTLRAAAGLKFSLFEAQSQLGDEDALEKRDAWLESMLESDRPSVAETAAGIVVLRDLQTAVAASKADGASEAIWKPVITRTIRLLQATKANVAAAEVAGQVTEQLEEYGEPVWAAPALRKFAEELRGSGDERMAVAAERLETKARKLELPGNAMVLTGTQPDGTPFDLKEMEGRVVLVDFWATWCRPCIEAFPELEELYEDHHADGLEIVGVNQDDKLELLTEFLESNPLPWTHIQNLGGDGERPHPNAERYGVNAIPFLVLVGRDGKVVKANVKPGQLAELIEVELAKKAPAGSADGGDRSANEGGGS